MIRLFVTEDHPVIITGLKNLFRPSRDEIEITGSASNVDDTVARAEPDSFDVLLLDLWLPDANPLVNVKKLKERFPGKPIVIFTSETSTAWQRKMFEAGIMAYLLKSANKSEIKTTLEKVSKGQIVFSAMAEPDPLKKLPSIITGQKFNITENQKELVELLSLGLTQQQIADKKKISVSTVEKTIKHVRGICNAKNNAELVKIFLEKGLI